MLKMKQNSSHWISPQIIQCSISSSHSLKSLEEGEGARVHSCAQADSARLEVNNTHAEEINVSQCPV
jgi:hypothetical protein